jgi:hypothetical protein
VCGEEEEWLRNWRPGPGLAWASHSGGVGIKGQPVQLIKFAQSDSLTEPGPLAGPQPLQRASEASTAVHCAVRLIRIVVQYILEVCSREANFTNFPFSLTARHRARVRERGCMFCRLLLAILCPSWVFLLPDTPLHLGYSRYYWVLLPIVGSWRFCGTGNSLFYGPLS